MSKPLAIDLFCGLGGWSDGLLACGWDVVGFDIEAHRYPARSLPDAVGAQKNTGGSWFVPPAGRKCAAKNNPDGRLPNFRDAPLTGGWIEYPAQLVVQDVLTLHGSQFKSADLIVASPPCQEYSYMAMPWSRAKAIAAEYRAGTRDVRQLTALFDACFRIQREACEAAGRHIPMIVENVRGAIPWVGRSRWNFGSYHLWGDVPALMPITLASGTKGVGPTWEEVKAGATGSHWTNPTERLGFKSHGLNWSDQTKRGQDRTRVVGKQAAEGRKHHGDWFRDPDCPTRQGGQVKRPVAEGRKGAGAGAAWFDSNLCQLPSASLRRKEASALIAKIPLPLATHIATVFRP